MSQFDPQAFLDAQTTSVDERRPPLPVENPADSAGLYTAIIGEPSIKSGEKDGKPWVSVLIPLGIEVPQQLQEQMKLQPKVTLTDRVFLDLTADGQGLDESPGRNSGRKRYRDATGTNVKGEPFGWRMLTGRPVKVKISHEMYNDAVQERIAGIFKMA